MTLPTITLVVPGYGNVAGGTTVTLTGSGFSVSPPVVEFGGVLGTNVVVASDTSLTVVSPAGASAPSLIDITVTTTAGTSLLTHADEFAYINFPVATFTTSSPYFDVQANYIFWGQIQFIQTPILPNGTVLGSGQWNIVGNSLTAPGVFGTTTAQPISFVADNVQWMNVTSGGSVSLTPSAFSVVTNGGITISAASAIGPIHITNTAGDLTLEGTVVGLGDANYCHFINIGNVSLPSTTTISGLIFAPDLANTVQTNVVGYDVSTGQLFYQAAASASNAWLLTGNSNVTSSSFIGPTNAEPFVIKVLTGAVATITDFQAWTVSASTYAFTGTGNYAITTTGASNISFNAGQNFLWTAANDLVLTANGAAITIYAASATSTMLLLAGSGGFSIDAPTGPGTLTFSTVSIEVGALNYPIFTSDANSNITIGQNSAITTNTIDIGLPASSTSINGFLYLVNPTTVTQTEILGYNSSTGLVTVMSSSAVLTGAWLVGGNAIAPSTTAVFGTTTTSGINFQTDSVTFLNVDDNQNVLFTVDSFYINSPTAQFSANMDSFIFSIAGSTTGTISATKAWTIDCASFTLNVTGNVVISSLPTAAGGPTQHPVIWDSATGILYASP